VFAATTIQARRAISKIIFVRAESLRESDERLPADASKRCARIRRHFVSRFEQKSLAATRRWAAVPSILDRGLRDTGLRGELPPPPVAAFWGRNPLMSESSQYDYELPRDLIAQRPPASRTDARLMVIDRAAGTLAHRSIRDLPELLDPRDCLIINDTRVVPARLIGRRSNTQGRWEGLFLGVDAAGRWRLLCKTRGHLAPGETVDLLDNRGRDDVRLLMEEKQPGGMWLALPLVDEPTYDLLDRVGRVPLPHYIRGGEMERDDRLRYQTVYARNPGAVAAPTAGLHFTNELLGQLVDRGVTICRLTLHVGLDTFRPLKAERLADHPMHHETGEISPATVDKILDCRARGGRVVAVGTTSVRVLETAARDGQLRPWAGDTNLFIKPPYTFHAVDALLTNFHLPRTTLLVLVRTFGGDELIMRAYHEAIREQYRFYSYGDAMLIL
jgi:S-adenosylmethionine:tRNA ribosyltransferase-isomerase